LRRSEVVSRDWGELLLGVCCTTAELLVAQQGGVAGGPSFISSVGDLRSTPVSIEVVVGEGFQDERLTRFGSRLT
jgi:hypothetical protein